MRKLIFSLVLIVLSACNFLAPPTAVPSEPLVIPASVTPSPIPSATATLPVPTVSPSPTADPNFFRDDFDAGLTAPWTWVRENAENWSLTNIPGALQISVSQGYVSSHTNTNLLLRPAPSGNFQIETQLTFRPEDNFQFAGLIVYESDSTFIQAGRKYCRSFDCVGEGLYMDYYKNRVAIKPDFGQSYRESKPVLLRLSRQEKTYTFEASIDGKIWFVVGSHVSDMQPLKIGLVTGQRVKGNPNVATFDYFQVRSLP